MRVAPNSADAGSSNFAPIVVFALIMTGSDVSAGRPDAGASTFASITVGFAFFSANWGLSRTWAIDGCSVLVAIAELIFIVAELVVDDAGAGSIDRLNAIPLRQPDPLVSVHASILACGGKRQLQPTRVAARTPMKSVLMLIPHKGPELCSQFLRRSNVALVVYHLRKSVNCYLSARPSRQALVMLTINQASIRRRGLLLHLGHRQRWRQGRGHVARCTSHRTHRIQCRAFEHVSAVEKVSKSPPQITHAFSGFTTAGCFARYMP